MNKILSVSVASYNVEQFIRQNMDSFVGTEVSSKIELLIVDDGSKDNTAAIAREYEEKYPETIKLVQQKNAGPGATVNTGLKHATGKYFRMVDGDDWVNKADLVRYIRFLEENDVDVVYTDYCLVDNETGEEVPQHLNFEKKNVILPYNEVCDKLDVMMHNVTYKTSILKDNDFVMDNGFYTDTEYLLLPVKYLKTICVLDCMIYMYRISLATQSVNINSMVRNKKMHTQVLHRMVEDYVSAKKKKMLSKEQMAMISNRIVTICGTELSIILAQKPSKETLKALKKFEDFLHQKDSDLYKRFLDYKTMKVLKRSNYLLFYPVSMMHRKRTNAD